MNETATTESATTTAELKIGGMTCASCSARIEKRLNKIDGVQASVNYATEQASVVISDAVSIDEIVAAVQAVGYTAALPQPPTTSESGSADGGEADPDAPAVRDLRNRLVG